MSVKYSEYLDAVAVKHRILSYNSIAPKREPGTSGALPRIKLSLSEVAELLAPYCGVRILDQLKAVVPLAAYLMLFQLLVLSHPVEAAVTLGFGLIAVVIGLAVFMEGLSTGLMPFGNIIGDNLPKKASMFVVLVIIGILGVELHLLNQRLVPCRLLALQ